MRIWWTTGSITEERVCHNRSPLARWRVRFAYEGNWSGDIASQIIGWIKGQDRRAFLLNCDSVIFADLDAATLFLMKFGR